MLRRNHLVMLDIKAHYEKGKKVGMKPGGISDADTALTYLKILENVLGEPWLNNHLFRIGASRLADAIYQKCDPAAKVEKSNSSY